MDAWKRLVEFAFDATLTQEQSGLLQDELVERWQEVDNPARAEIGQAKAAWRQVASTTGPQKEVFRLSLREQLLEAVRLDADDPANKLVLDLYESANPLLVEGDPPLRKGSIDALVSLFEWLASQAVGQPGELTELERQEVAVYLVRHYPHAAPGDRMLLSHMEEMLPWLKVEWEEAGLESQGHFRANLAELFGIPRPLLPAPYTGETDTWEHPDGLFTLEYPRDWPARYGGLPDGTTVAGWPLFDVTILGDAPSETLELTALPAAGALIVTGALPEDAREDRITIEEAVFALSSELLSAFGVAEPLGESASSDGAVLTAWRHQSEGREFSVWVSAVLLPEPPGAAIITLTRAPAADAPGFEPAFSRIIHTLRLGDSDADTFTDILELPSAPDLTLDLLNTPLRGQMDLVEGLTSGVR